MNLNARRVHRRAVLQLAVLGTASFRFPNLAYAGGEVPRAAQGQAIAQETLVFNADISTPTSDAVPLGAWVLISRSGVVTLLCNHAEMGQGITTALAMLLAEELEVSMSRVRVRIAPPMERYKNPRFNRQLTGESASVRGMYQGLREAGAQVRDQLLRAAANAWGVPLETLQANQGMVLAADGRQLSYGAVAAQAAQLAPRSVALKQPKNWKLIGTKLARIDTAPKINGTAIFGIDVKLPGLVYAAIRMGPVLGSTVRSFDRQKIAYSKEIIDILSIGDGVVVVATTWWIAHRACQALSIEWNTGNNAKLSTEGMRRGFRRALSDGEALLAEPQKGDSAKVLSEARRVHKFEFWSHSLAHATMEPMNFTAHWDGRRMRLIGPTQYPDSAQSTVARALSLEPQAVKVETTYIGCGFGRRVETDVEVQAAKIAFAIKRPVKLLWSREEDMTHGFYRPIAVNTLQVACDAQGWPIALDWLIATQSIKERIWGWDTRRLDGTMVEYANPPYRIPNTRFRAIHHNAGMRVGFMRSVSHAFNVFANEGMIDELATLAKRDPLDYRLALIEPGSRYEKVLTRLAELSSWRKPAPSGRFRGIALMYGYESVLAMVAEVSLSDFQVKVHRVSCVVDVGQVINAAGIAPQIESSVIFGLGAALLQEITFEQGRVQQKNFDSYPLPSMRDMPQVDTQVIESDASPGGIGEPGAALVQAAIANAVSAALKRRVRSLPMTAANLRNLMART